MSARDQWAKNLFCLQIIMYSDVLMSMMASQITSVFIIYSTVCSGADEGKHQSLVSLAFVRRNTDDRWIPHAKGQ